MKNKKKEVKMSDEWKVSRLGDVAEMYQPRTISQEEMVDDGQYLVYGANGVIGRYDKYNHEHPQLLVTCRGATCGTINVSTPFAWITGNSMVVVPSNDILSFNYLKYYLSKEEIMRFVITGAAQPQITRANLSQLKISYPTSLEKQQEIAAVLDKASELVEKRKAQLAELDTLAESIFYDMFGDPVTNEKGWKVKLFGDICSLRAGDFVKAAAISENNEEGLFPCYGGNGLRGFVQTYTHNGIYVLIGRQGALCGNVKYVNGVFHATEHAVVVTHKEEINAMWLYYCLYKLDLNRFATGAAQPGLAVNKLNTVDIIFPPLPLQQQFAQIIEKIEEQKQKVKAALKESEDLFQRLMQDMFNPEYHK